MDCRAYPLNVLDVATQRRAMSFRITCCRGANGCLAVALVCFCSFHFQATRITVQYSTYIEMNLAVISLSGPKVHIACWIDDLVSGDVPLLLDQIPFLINPHVSSVCSWHPIIDIIVCAVDPLFVRK